MSSSTPSSRRPPSRCQTATSVCPTCHRPFEVTKKTTESKKKSAPEDDDDKMPDWPCPHLAPSLLAPMTKRPVKYSPFVSGQNSSACTVFYDAKITATETSTDKKSKKSKKPTSTDDPDDSEGVVDELIDAYY